MNLVISHSVSQSNLKFFEFVLKFEKFVLKFKEFKIEQIQDSISSPFQRKKEKETKFVLKFEKLKIERISERKGEQIQKV